MSVIDNILMASEVAGHSAAERAFAELDPIVRATAPDTDERIMRAWSALVDILFPQGRAAVLAADLAAMRDRAQPTEDGDG